MVSLSIKKEGEDVVSMKKMFSGVMLEVVQGDITAQGDIGAVVNAANAQLRTGGGVAGAIHRAAGPGLEDECRSLAPIKPGQAVITTGHRLPNQYVIHCLGPVYGRDTPSDTLLADCYKNALDLADSHDVTSVAFPAISTGIFGYPKEDAAQVAFRTIVKKAPNLENVKVIRFVLFDKKSLDIHCKVLEKISL